MKISGFLIAPSATLITFAFTGDCATAGVPSAERLMAFDQQVYARAMLVQDDAQSPVVTMTSINGPHFESEALMGKSKAWLAGGVVKSSGSSIFFVYFSISYWSPRWQFARFVTHDLSGVEKTVDVERPKRTVITCMAQCKYEENFRITVNLNNMKSMSNRTDPINFKVTADNFTWNLMISPSEARAVIAAATPYLAKFGNTTELPSGSRPQLTKEVPSARAAEMRGFWGGAEIGMSEDEILKLFPSSKINIWNNGRSILTNFKKNIAGSDLALSIVIKDGKAHELIYGSNQGVDQDQLMNSYKNGNAEIGRIYGNGTPLSPLVMDRFINLKTEFRDANSLLVASFFSSNGISSYNISLKNK